MAVNGDEGEPGTFKDRYYLEKDPHRFIEGTLIAAWVVEAADIYIYLRDEYPEVRQMLEAEIGEGEKRRPRTHARSTCAAAPAPISAAKSPR
jgi:formate dehydrogenase beta subunit